MFVTKEFIEKYSARAKDITIEGVCVTEMSERAIIALLAYFYEMYMSAREYVPGDEIR